MNAVARPWIGLCFKLMAFLAAIFAFVFLMTMDEERSRVGKYREFGTVSRGVVTEMKLDTVVIEGRRGRSRSVNVQYLFVRFAPESKIKFTDFPSKVKEADLPTAPPQTGDTSNDSKYVDILEVPRIIYDKTKVGDMLTVVDAPFSGFGPEMLSVIRDFDPSKSYPKIAISLLLALLLGVVGWRISKTSSPSQPPRASRAPGMLP